MDTSFNLLNIIARLTESKTFEKAIANSLTQSASFILGHFNHVLTFDNIAWSPPMSYLHQLPLRTFIGFNHR